MYTVNGAMLKPNFNGTFASYGKNKQLTPI